MWALLRQIAILILTVAFWWLFTDWVSFKSGIDAERLDTHQAYIYGEGKGMDYVTPVPGVRSIFKHRGEAAIAGTYLLNLTDKPKMVIMGCSSTEQGFRPDQLAPLFPEYEIHNLSVTYVPLCEIRVILNKAIAAISPEVMKKSVFVLSVWYNAFVREETVASIIPDMEYRMYPYLHTANAANQVVTIFSDEGMIHALRVLRALYYIRYLESCSEDLAHDCVAWALDRLPGSANWRDKETPAVPMPALPLPMRINDVVQRGDWDSDVGRWELPPWNTGMKDSQFEILMDICNSIHQRGGSIVLVDLPMSSVHRIGKKQYQEYQNIKMKWYDKAAKEYGARHIEMGNFFADNTYWDWTHPNFWARPMWSYYLWLNWDKARQHGPVESIDDGFLRAYGLDPGPPKVSSFDGLIAVQEFLKLPVELFVRVRAHKPLGGAEFTASSSYPGYEPNYALGHNKDLEWCLQGPSGWLKVTLPTEVVAGGVALRPRHLSHDPIEKGRIRINNEETYEFKNLVDPAMLLVTFKKPIAVKTIEVIIDPGDARLNPGVSEVWLFD